MTSSTAYAALADLSVEFCPPPPAPLDDSELLALKGDLSEIRRRLDAADALVSAEIAHRSRRELGYDGLAQRLGARTPEMLIQRVAGVSAKDARTQVRGGSMMTAVTSTVDSWLAEVATAVAAGKLSLDGADAIRVGLGAPSSNVTEEHLRSAARALLGEASSLTVERLAARAREARASLDVSHVAERESELREKRYLHLTPLADGMTRLVGLLDPESAAQVTAVFDAATSPRRGGPRFVDATLATAADALVADTRTTEQIALDTFIELLRLGTHADVSAFVGARRLAVQVLVTEADRASGRGMGFIEGQSEPISVASVERHLCESGEVPILFEGGDVVNLGREMRLFSRKQRIGLAARDGGCIWPDCDRPPSWCEAHHVNEWWRHRGRTDIADGVLLCKHHHLLVHNNEWRVIRSGDQYALVPPASVDAERRPIPIATKSAALRRLSGARP